jgi:hypothetical protein
LLKNSFLEILMKRYLHIYALAICFIILCGCGGGDNPTPCVGKTYSTPSVYVNGSYVYTSAYARNIYADPSASTCTDNTSAYDLVFGMSQDGGETWTTKTVKEAISPSSSPIYLSPQAIATDSSNRIFISYVDNSNILYCAYSSDNGSTWAYSRVENTASTTVTDHAIITDSANKIYIVFTATNTVNGTVTLKYGKSTDNGATWTTNFIDSTDQAGYHPSISIDSSSILHVSYYYAEIIGGLKYAKSSDGASTWTTVNVKINDGTVSGPLSSIAATTGAIYIAFYNPESYAVVGGSYTENKDGILQIMKSVDGGTTWTGPVTVDSTTYTGKAPAISAVGSSVYIAYGYYQYDDAGTVSNNKLKFASSTDSAVNFTVQSVELDSGLAVNNNVSSLSFLSPSMKYYTLNGTGKLYLVYAGSSGANVTFKTSSNGGTTWGSKSLAL